MSPFYRQNDKRAIVLLRASYRCLSNERAVKYLIIISSFLVCLSGIINKYLPMIFKNIDSATILSIQYNASKYINLCSGFVLILSTLLSFYTARMHFEGVSLQDRYESYVYNINENPSIYKPLSQPTVDIYAGKVKKNDDKFYNLYYNTLEDVSEDTAHYDNLSKQFHSEYRLYMSIQPFFLSLWIGFCMVILIIALSFDDKFINTLVNILFPSLSAITIIANSAFAFRLQVKCLQKCISLLDDINRLPEKQKLAYITNKQNLRMLQDGLFNFRSSAFAIPNFLVKHHEKQLAKENWGYGHRRSSDLIVAVRDKQTLDNFHRKTEARVRSNKSREAMVPTLCLPEMDTQTQAPAMPKTNYKKSMTAPKGTEILQLDSTPEFKEIPPPSKIKKASAASESDKGAKAEAMNLKTQAFPSKQSAPTKAKTKK